MTFRKRYGNNSRDDKFRQQADNSNHGQEEDPNDSANIRKRWLRNIFKGRHWLPWIYLCIFAYFILPEKETFALIYKLGHGIWLVLLVLLVVVLLLLSFIFEWRFKGTLKGKDSSLEGAVGIVVISLFCPMLAIPYFEFSVINHVNDSEVGPPTTVETYVHSKWEQSRSSKNHIKFIINGNILSYDLPRSRWEKFKEGDPISVTYSIGCLNRIVFNDVHVIDKKVIQQRRTREQIYNLPSNISSTRKTDDDKTKLHMVVHEGDTVKNIPIEESDLFNYDYDVETEIIEISETEAKGTVHMRKKDKKKQK